MAQLLSPVSTVSSTDLNSEHTFSLKSLNQSTQLTFDFQSHFYCDCDGQQELLLYSLPTFNNDKKYFTPAFTVRSYSLNNNPTQNNEQKNLKTHLQNFQRKIKSSVQSQGQLIYQARPQSNYCQICSQTFDDYKKHIDHPIHAKKLKDTKISYEINCLIELFHTKNKTTLKRPLPSLSQSEKEAIMKNQQDQSYFKSFKKIKKQNSDNQMSQLLSNQTNKSAQKYTF